MDTCGASALGARCQKDQGEGVVLFSSAFEDLIQWLIIWCAQTGTRKFTPHRKGGGRGGELVPSQMGCGKCGGSPWIERGTFGGHSRKTNLNPVAPKARKQTFDLAPGFCVANLAAKLKRQISHTKSTAHQPPPPSVERKLGPAGSGSVACSGEMYFCMGTLARFRDRNLETRGLPQIALQCLSWCTLP